MQGDLEFCSSSQKKGIWLRHLLKNESIITGTFKNNLGKVNKKIILAGTSKNHPGKNIFLQAQPL